MAVITIDVENRAGVKQGAGPIVTAFDLSYTTALDRAGSFQFVMPAIDPKAALLTQRTAVVRIYRDSTVVFVGVVESVRRAVGSDGVMGVQVGGRSLLVEMVETLAGIDNLVNNQIAPYLLRPTPWGFVYKSGGAWIPYVSGALTTASVYGRMWGETALSALVKIAERINEHFVYLPWTDGDRKVRWVGTNFDDSGVRAIQGAGEAVQAEGNEAVCFILNMEQMTDNHDTVNRVYAYGGGNGDAALTLAASTATVSGYTISAANSTVVHDARQSAWGFYVDKRLQFSDITPISNTDADLENAANYLARAAAAWLERNEATTYELSVFKLPTAVTPGTTLRVVYEDDALTVDTALLVLSVETQVGSDGQAVHRLIVTDAQEYPPTEYGEVVGNMEQGTVYIAHPQMNAAVMPYSFSEVIFDDTFPAELFFPTGNAISQIEQVVLFFRVDPLISTSVSATTAAGGASAPTSSAGSSHTHEIPGHVHTVTLNNSGSFHALVGLTAPSGGTSFLVNDSGGTIDINTDSGSGGATSESEGAHTHSVTVGTHTHDMTSTFGGITKDTANTTTTADVTVEIDGGPPTNSRVVFAGQWSTIDLTPDVSNTTTRRPNALAHTVTVQAGASSGLMGRVTAIVEVRGIIQAIAYS